MADNDEKVVAEFGARLSAVIRLKIYDALLEHISARKKRFEECLQICGGPEDRWYYQGRTDQCVEMERLYRTLREGDRLMDDERKTVRRTKTRVLAQVGAQLTVLVQECRAIINKNVEGGLYFHGKMTAYAEIRKLLKFLQKE